MAESQWTETCALETDPLLTDPPLLKNHSCLKTYSTTRFVYPDIRVFFRPHAKDAQLPKTPAPLPLLVCIPGLGGSVAQFHPLLRSLVDLAPCLSMDFPGCGRSRYAVRSWDAYTPEALGELLEMVIEDHRDKENSQGVVLIGHSMGTALAAQLTSTLTGTGAPHKSNLAQHIVSLVAICPIAEPPKRMTASLLRLLLRLPNWVLDLWRLWDARGGINSPSVSRFVGKCADKESRELQYRFNRQSRTSVWRRMAYGALPAYRHGKLIGGLPGIEAWANIVVPVYLIAGADDRLACPQEAEKILQALNANQQQPPGPSQNHQVTSGTDMHHQAALNGRETGEVKDSDAHLREFDSEVDLPSGTSSGSRDNLGHCPSEHSRSLPAQPDHPSKFVQSFIMPSPANHALLYMPRCSRVLAGLISDFLANHVTQRLSLAWQLQYFSREGKWDVKNLNKWKSVTPVSDIIGPDGEPIFRAMKTLREADDVHSPSQLVDKWGSVIKDVIDISRDQPVYDPLGLERGGVHYHKFPTASKIPPQPQEVDGFIRLVDKVRAGQKERALAEGWEHPEECVVGVHCHYGFNRTGFFIVCYLVEKCGFRLQDAIENFARARPNGIRHSHFLDRLFVRYNIEQSLDQQQQQGGNF